MKRATLAGMLIAVALVSSDLRASEVTHATPQPSSEVAHATSPPCSPATAPAMGVHGMLLFGGHDGLFASHLPMFHAPHDAQVVLRIRFADAALEQQMRDELPTRPRVWTLSPERFDLLRLQPGACEPLSRFTVDVFDGHFERGGVQRQRAASVIVEKVILFRHLMPDTPRPASWHYRRIAASATAREQFLLLTIAGQPGADHVVALQPGVARLPDSISVPAQPGVLHAGLADIAEALAATGAAVRAEIYRETDDLR